MRLLVDLQPLFAPTTAKRGIGLYATQLAAALCRVARGHEVHLLLADLGDPDALVEQREAFRHLVRHERVHLLEPVPVSSVPLHEAPTVSAGNEAVREAVIAAVAPDAVLVTSLFELGPDGATSVRRWGPGPVTAVVLYDLMPLEAPDELLADPRVRSRYYRSLEDLRRADVLLAISEYSAERAAALLEQCPPCVPILGAAIPAATGGGGRLPDGLAGRAAVLCVGGDHPRKNLDGLVRGWARVPETWRAGRALVLACTVSEQTRRRLHDVATQEGLRRDEVVVTGWVSPDDLHRLYDEAELFVFPSFSEGLGLPALEAMEHGCAVLVADATSLRELVTSPEGRFDPGDPSSIAAAIERALRDDALMARLRQQSRETAARFTWEGTAARTWDALESLVAGAAPAAAFGDRRLAVVSPWPPARSGVADYALRTARALADHYEVVLVGEAPEQAGLEQVSRTTFAETWHHYDRILYHLGNSPFHTADMALLPQAPGVVLLHDTTLAGTLRFTDEALDHPDGVESLLQESGTRGHAGTTDQAGVRTVLSGALGVQVHSRHAAAEVARAGFSQAPVAVVPHPVLDAVVRAPRARTPGQPLVVGHFGFVQAFKQPELLLQAAALAAARLAQGVEVVFVGAVSDAAYRARLERLAAEHRVEARFLGYVSSEELARWTARVDCAVQLRSTSHGESSGSVTRLLAAGIPTVVSDLGSFADLPPAVVRHHPPGGSAEVLAATLVECLTPESADALGRRAAAYAAGDLSLATWADRTRDTVERSYRQSVAVQAATRLRHAVPGVVSGAASPFVDAIAQDAGRARGSASSVWASDVSVLTVTPYLTGIQRVVLSLHRELSTRVGSHGVGLVAADVAAQAVPLAAHASIRADPVLSGVRVEVGDCAWLLCLDLDFGLVQAEADLQHARARGTRVLVNVYDMLIVSNPEWFVPHAADSVFLPWLRTVVRVADVITVNSSVTARLLRDWIGQHAPHRQDRVAVHVLPLGVEPPPEVAAPRARAGAPHFTVVGTLEPRKGHDDLLDAFDRLWVDGHDVRLTVVGRQGWMVEQLVERLEAHHERGGRLNWLRGADDEALEEVLRASDGVIVPSRGEGFGLPIVEAAARGLPLVVRDVPVLREVAGEGATFFSGGGPQLATVLAAWTARWAQGEPLGSQSIRTHSWGEVADLLIDLLRAR